ncbi:Appr-1-p processing domain-containing protein [Pseudoscardovia radai]|uniref:Appr-1-p processing domain-containing protein n=2 Tax=Pseudoscardovia radai TaxID=987066 RepID=A0A261EXH0_9BIFI|nr:Appr-1-p processing domain-containing protein [Pseudoscardovia radai]
MTDARRGTVAFCCISTGVFRFPKREAARIAVDTVRTWLDGHAGSSVRRVVFDVFGDDDREIYRQALA